MTLKLKAFIKDKSSSDAVKEFLLGAEMSAEQLSKGTISEAATALESEESPEFLLVELTSKDTEKAFADLDGLANSVDPGTKVVVCGKIDELSFYKELIGMGVHEYLLTPLKVEQLEKLTSAQAPQSATSSAPQAVAREDTQVIGIIGTRGGVGASTLAMNLAGIFAKRDYPTAVLDLDPQLGTIPLYADVEASRGLVDALEKPERVDSLFLDRVMTKVNDSLYVIGAEKNLLEPANISPEAAEKIINQLKTKFAYIIVDISSIMPFAHHVLQNYETLIVTEQSIAGLRDTMRIYDLVKTQLKNDVVKVVTNKVGLNAKFETTQKDFESGLGRKVDHSLPFELDSYGFGDSGKILAIDDTVKKSKLSNAINDIAKNYMPDAVGVKKDGKAKKGLLGGLLGKK